MLVLVLGGCICFCVRQNTLVMTQPMKPYETLTERSRGEGPVNSPGGARISAGVLDPSHRKSLCIGILEILQCFVYELLWLLAIKMLCLG